MFLDIQNNNSYFKEFIKKQIARESLFTDTPNQTEETRSYLDRTFVINIREILTFLCVAEEVNTALIDKNTFYLHDLSAYQETEYNSLIFQIDGRCFKSKESTLEIMSRFSLINQVPYVQIQMIGQMVGIKQKCPYVIGNYYFAPDRGTTRNQANWIALHHVLYYEGTRSSSYFVFRNYHELRLPLSEEAVQKMVEKVCVLYKLNEALINQWLKSQQHASKVAFLNNVVQETLQYTHNGEDLPTFNEIFHQICFTKGCEIAAKILGEPHLTIDELKEIYPSWFGKK